MTSGLANTGSTSDGTDLAGAMDALSLEQALLDTELANARVIDLTRRLLEALAETERLRLQMDSLERGELERVKAERDELAVFRARLTGSRPFKLVQRVRTLPGVDKILGRVVGV
jgi:hypothetical protein